MTHGSEERCHVERIQPGVADPPVRTESLLLAVQGMGCPNCANRVYNALVRLSGVANADVALESRAARVEYDPDHTEPENLVRAIEEAGRASGHRYAAAPIPAPGFTR